MNKGMNENDENYIEALEKIMKKLRKIKYDLLKSNIEKYMNEKQNLVSKINCIDYLDNSKPNKTLSQNYKREQSVNFLDEISNSTKINKSV